MISKLNPVQNKVYQIEKHTMIHVLSGIGGIQVDFKNHHNWREKIIFLEKGQYIKFLTGEFTVLKIEFEDESMSCTQDVRVLFKHLISLGYIDCDQCKDSQNFLSEKVYSDNGSNILDIFSQQWYQQNPFDANKQEYQLIFDVKDIIDQECKNHLSSHDLTKLVNSVGYDAHALYRNKVGVSVKQLLHKKRLVESKKEIIFTDKSIKEISYSFGYKDPAYFNRVFKNLEGMTPNDFRGKFELEKKDLFIQDIYELLKSFHMEEHTVGFYADKMNLSVKTISRKVKSKLNVSLTKLIRLELINTAKGMLMDDVNVNTVSRHLRFEEANHFSSFFKHHTGITPTEYKIQKYN